MFAKDVLRILQVSRPTLTKYVKTGIIRVHVMPNGHYDYNEADVYKFLNKDVKRKSWLYPAIALAVFWPVLYFIVQYFMTT